MKKRKPTWFTAAAVAAAAWLCGGAQASAQEAGEEAGTAAPGILFITFKRTGAQASAVTVNVADETGYPVEDATATLSTDPESLKNSGSAVTSAIVCPERNANTNQTVSFTVTINGLPAGFTFDTAEATVHPLNSSGDYQTSERQWNVTLKQGGSEEGLTEFATLRDYTFAGRQASKPSFTGDAATAGGTTLVLRLEASKGTNNDGCFFGLESLVLYTAAEGHGITDGLYRIVNANPAFEEAQDGKQMCLYYDAAQDKVRWHALDMAEAGNVFHVEVQEDGRVTLKNANAGKYMQGVAGALADTKNENGLVTLSRWYSSDRFQLVFGNGTMHAGGHNQGAGTEGDLQAYAASSYTSFSNWHVVPATTIDVALNSTDEAAYWATLHLPFDVRTGEGVTACTGSLATEDGERVIALSPVGGDGTVTANTAVVLTGTAPNATLEITGIGGGGATAAEGNILRGTNTPVDIGEGQDEAYYVLGTYDGEVGFYFPHDELGQLAANKAYVDASDLADEAAAPNAAGYRFALGGDGGQATGIDAATAPGSGEGVGGEPLYDLSGRRVASPAKGIYIRGGKKIYVK